MSGVGSLTNRLEIKRWGEVGVMLLDGKPYAYCYDLPFDADINDLNDILQDIIREVEGKTW